MTPMLWLLTTFKLRYNLNETFFQDYLKKWEVELHRVDPHTIFHLNGLIFFFFFLSSYILANSQTNSGWRGASFDVVWLWISYFPLCLHVVFPYLCKMKAHWLSFFSNFLSEKKKKGPKKKKKKPWKVGSLL